jgi:hypothetical protein
MTMQHQIHPDDERLAALAGGDPELGSDAELRAHVSSCDACRATIDELSMLRSALAELPDLVPSRRLQLLPPVAEPRAAVSTGGWLRRLSAPIMAAGLGLVLVGAVGTSGLLSGFAPAAGERLNFDAAQPSSQAARSRAGDVGPTVSPRPPALLPSATRSLRGEPSPAVGDNSGSESGASPSAAVRAPAAPATPSGSRENAQSTSSDQPTAPWLALLLAGVAFLVTGVVLRLSVPHD